MGKRTRRANEVKRGRWGIVSTRRKGMGTNCWATL